MTFRAKPRVKPKRKDRQIVRVAKIAHDQKLQAHLSDLDINRFLAALVRYRKRYRFLLEAIECSFERACQIRHLRSEFRILCDNCRQSPD